MPVEVLPAAVRQMVEHHVMCGGVLAGEADHIRLSISGYAEGWCAAQITYRLGQRRVETFCSLPISADDAAAVLSLQRDALAPPRPRGW